MLVSCNNVSACFGLKLSHFQATVTFVLKGNCVTINTLYWLEIKISVLQTKCEGWNFNSGSYLFTTDTK